MCRVLKCDNYYESIELYIKENNIFYLKDINKNYRKINKNLQKRVKFINELGFYDIITKSERDHTRMHNWLSHTIMPSLRNYGELISMISTQEKIDKLNQKKLIIANTSGDNDPDVQIGGKI